MNWKKFKKELVSLNYTVMLLPHSERKPIHFKIPVWVLGLIFLLLLIFTGTCLFFAGSRYQLAEVQRQKEELEQEWMQLTLEKQAADEENEELRAAQEAQAEELKLLEQEARDMIQELENLVQRESEIRNELGLTQEALEPNEEAAESNEESFDLNEEAFQSEDGASQSGEISFEPLSLLMDDMTSFQLIQEELSHLQNDLVETTSEYDAYWNVIMAKKAAEAEERARKEALRTSVADTALSYIGSPYVYGGSNPNTGTDCSGFTLYIFEQTAGISLNRTAASQSTQGHPVSPEAIRPGDLVFYSSGGSIDHVAIYIGDGQIVHAANGRKGVIQSDMYYQPPVKFVNILGD